MMLPKEGEDKMMQTKNELLDKVTGLLAGRVSEELFIGEIGTGAYSDFQRATGIVRRMITEFGMSDKLGPMQFGTTQGQVFLGRDIGHEQNYSDAIAYEIDQEMQSIIRACYERAKQILTKYSDQVRLIAETLIEKETLEKDQIKELIDSGKLGAVPDEEPALDGKNDDVKVNIQSQDQAADSNKLDIEKKSSDDEQDQ